MSKGLLWSLIILALTVVVLILQGGSDVKVDFWVTELNGLKSLVFLCFTAIGVIIGVLLK